MELFRSLGAFSSTEASVTANVSGALPAAPPTPPAPGQQNRRCAVPSPPFPRFRSVVMLTSCSSRPHPRIPAGMTWLVNSGSAILMPDPPPTLDFLCFTERLLSLWDNALNFTSVFFRMPFVAMSISHTHRDTSVTLKNLKVPRGCWTPSHSPRRSREAGASRRDAA